MKTITPLDVELFEDLSPNNVMANNSEVIFFHFENQGIASGDGKTTNQNLADNGSSSLSSLN